MATLDGATIAKLAESFCLAEERLVPRSLVTEAHADLSLDDAYAIQFAAVERKRAGGRQVLGYKVGFASRSIQEKFGMHEPMFGHLLDDAIHPSGASLARNTYIHPGIEPELAFVLDRPLRGPGVAAEQVLAATRQVMPAFEVVDFRFPSWQFKAADSIADNGFNAGAVLGGAEAEVSGLGLPQLGMVVEKNGRQVGEATAEAVLGHPANSVAWLVNKLAEFDRALEAGHYVLSGSFTTTYAAEAGDEFRATYERLDAITVRFR